MDIGENLRFNRTIQWQLLRQTFAIHLVARRQLIAGPLHCRVSRRQTYAPPGKVSLNSEPFCLRLRLTGHTPRGDPDHHQ